MRRQGVRDAGSYYEWDHFWTPAFQEGYRRDMVVALCDFVEEHCDGKALKFVSELKRHEWGAIRAHLNKRYYGYY